MTENSDSVSSKCECVDDSENFTMTSLAHYFVKILRTKDEVKHLVAYLRILEFKQAVVYVRDSVRCGSLCEILQSLGFFSTFVHELMPIPFRRGRLMMFKENEGDANILVTSCCGHVKEFQNVDVVIMFDGAETALVYNHRLASKVARKGLVLNFVRNEACLAVLKDVEKKYKVSIPQLPAELYTSAYIGESEG